MYVHISCSQVVHSVELKNTKDIIEFIRKEPEKVQLDWVLRLVQHHVEQDPNRIYIVDLLPNLKWLQRNEHLSNNADELLSNFEEKVNCALLGAQSTYVIIVISVDMYVGTYVRILHLAVCVDSDLRTYIILYCNITLRLYIRQYV